MSEPRGAPPAWMSEPQREAWEMFASELPWLGYSHRGILEIACIVRARLTTGEDVGIQSLNLLRLCLGQMGATPADSSKVVTARADGTDPADEFFR